MTTPMSRDELALERAKHEEHGSDFSRNRCTICRLLATIDAFQAEAQRPAVGEEEK